MTTPNNQSESPTGAEEIIRLCYEEKFRTQKYKESNLYHTYLEVIMNVIRLASEQTEQKTRKYYMSMLDDWKEERDEFVAKKGRESEQKDREILKILPIKYLLLCFPKSLNPRACTLFIHLNFSRSNYFAF